MKMPLVAGFAVVVVAALCQAEDLRFQTATVTRNMSGLASGGSQIQPGGRVAVTNIRSVTYSESSTISQALPLLERQSGSLQNAMKAEVISHLLGKSRNRR